MLSVEAYLNKLDEHDYPKGKPLARSRSVLAYDPALLDTSEGRDNPVALDAQQGLLLFESRFELNALASGTEIDANSLLLDDSGTIAYASDHNIGYRVAYIKPQGRRHRCHQRARSALSTR